MEVSQGRLSRNHVNRKHGPNSLGGKNDKPDTRFYESESIVKLIQGFLPSSKPSERGFLSKNSKDSTFQRKYGRNIGESKTFDKYKSLKLYSDTLQVRTNSGDIRQRKSNKVETAFPLYKGFGGINGN